MMLFPLYYFPPIPWFAAALQADTLHLDLYQPYRKQQYFSRMHIKGAHQTLTLTIPVERRSKRKPLCQKSISHAENWKTQHWRSLVFSYPNSPFFSYYEDVLKAVYTPKSERLSDFLAETVRIAFSLIGHSPTLEFTSVEPVKGKVLVDFRKDFPPDLENLPDWFVVWPYEQVFGKFTPGLSILDLLCNLGPESRLFLEKSFDKARVSC